jgi:hypothetical protein
MRFGLRIYAAGLLAKEERGQRAMEFMHCPYREDKIWKYS